jgi:predicted metalloprotease
MRWRSGRRSDNIEDRRGSSGGMGGLGGLGGGRGGGSLLPLLLGLVGRKGGIWIILGLVAVLYFTGGNLGGLLDGMSGMQPGLLPGEQPAQTSGPVQQSATERELSEFVSVVLADTEDTWHALFRQRGETYVEPTLVLFRGATRSACGIGQAAMGPFYCPADQKVYIDLSFYEDLRSRFRAPGDFAQAYVIAHEVGHHVQTLLGISPKVAEAQRGLGEAEANRLTVRLELQADCFSGLWAHHADKARSILESGDIEEALTAASAIGDDRLQRQSKGYVTPDSFTHGTSAQRMRWFKIGLQSGQLAACDTFNTDTL